MLAHQQPQSRWAAFIERMDGGLERFRQTFDPFDQSPERRMRPWAIAALSLGVLVLAGLVGLGVWWVIDHHKWGLIYPMLKMAKLLCLGIGILVAAVYALTKKSAA